MALIFAFPGYENFAKKISEKTSIPLGQCTVSSFPDSETLVTIHSDVANKDVILVCGLDNPDTKVMPLMFFSNLAKEFKAQRIRLVAPYLGYMRQDIRFQDGQAITSKLFAQFLSTLIDELITLDPHLHRYKTLDEVYTIQTTTLHAAQTIGTWIENNIENPVLIGPDAESKQWVQAIAQLAHAPFTVLKKTRYGDRNVEISVPDIDAYKTHTPVLADDIISTAQTMIKTVEHLHNAGMKPPVCIGIHAVFADNAYEDLKKAGTQNIVTTNTITHETNGIDVTPLFADALK